MKRKSLKKLKFKADSLITKIAKILVILFVALFFNNIDNCSAWSDRQISKKNKISTASVDVNIVPASVGLIDSAVANDINYLETVERDFVVKNEGTEDVQYTIKYENISGVDNALCQTLGVDAKLNGGLVYDISTGPLSPSGAYEGFSHKVDNLSSGNSDSWELDITWYDGLGNRSTFEGMVCDFKFTFDAWQTTFSDSSQGWSDTDELGGNTIAVQDITPPVITTIRYSEPIETSNEANNIQLDITWNTNENATSKVVYDTVSHPSPAGSWTDYPYSAPLSDDTTADKMSHSVRLSGLAPSSIYYYRVISEDASGNLASSDQEGFMTNDPDTVAASTDIVMNEFLPDPIGPDTALMPGGEWLELYNRGISNVDVVGWYFKDRDGNRLDITAANSDSNKDVADAGETIVKAGGYLVVYDNSAFDLGNSDEWIYLYDSSNTLIDDYSFGYVGDYIAIHEGKTYARIPDGGFWVDPDGTPGEENELGVEEIKVYREAAFTQCFNGRDFDESQKNEAICNLEFLDYLGMIKSKSDLRIPSDVYATLVEEDFIETAVETTIETTNNDEADSSEEVEIEAEEIKEEDELIELEPPEEVEGEDETEDESEEGQSLINFNE